MTQDDVLQLFEQEAGKPGNTRLGWNDMIRALARVIAGSGNSLSEKDFDTLVCIGATLYRNSVSRDRAQSEIASTMRESVEHDRK